MLRAYRDKKLGAVDGQHKASLTSARIAKPSPAREKTDVARLYKRVGKQRISWIYKHVDGRSQTLASYVLGDRAARYDAERLATKLAVEIQHGVVVAGAVSEMMERIELKEDPTSYHDQSKDGKKIRKGMYTNLTKFFGRMAPSLLTAQLGYQYLEDRAVAAHRSKPTRS